MQETKLTSAGHALADTAWLDHDFEAWLRKLVLAVSGPIVI